MSQYILSFTFLSDATLGSGDGLTGIVDREIIHDRYGLPYMRGRQIKGLLSEETDNILFALEQQGKLTNELELARKVLLGDPGSSLDEIALLHYGRGMLAESIRNAIIDAIDKEGATVNRIDILESMTAIRRQTAIEDGFVGSNDQFDENAKTGTPVDGSLRAMRVMLRNTTLSSKLYSEKELSNLEEGLLCATVKAWRRAGSGRNRGRGRLVADLQNSDGVSILDDGFNKFKAEVNL